MGCIQRFSCPQLKENKGFDNLDFLMAKISWSRFHNFKTKISASRRIVPANISLKDFLLMLPRTIKKCNYFSHVKSSIFLRSEEKSLHPIQAIFHQHEWSNVSLFNNSHLCIASTYTYSQLRFYENCWHIFGHTCPEIERSPALPKSTVVLTIAD